MKTKAQIRLELDSYFEELMHIATRPNFPISADIMHKYVVVLAALKTMMRMLSDELERGARAMYRDFMESRVKFQKDVTLEHTDTITDYRSWHQYVTIYQREDVEELDFHGCLSHSDV